MTITRQLAQINTPRQEDARAMTIRVAGRGVFVVLRGNRELFRGTFEQCYDYVNAARQGLTC